MEFTAQQIAAIINGKIEGNPSASVRSFGKIEEATGGQLAFLANPKYEDFLYSTKATIIIINEDLELKEPVQATLIKVTDPYTAFATLLQTYEKLSAGQLTGIQEPSYICKSAQLGEQVFVGAFSYIGENVKVGNNVKIYPHSFIGNNVVIGDNCVLHPGVKIYHDGSLGNRITIHAGTVIGGDGFGFVDEQHRKLRLARLQQQFALARIGDAVEGGGGHLGDGTAVEEADRAGGHRRKRAGELNECREREGTPIRRAAYVSAWITPIIAAL